MMLYLKLVGYWELTCEDTVPTTQCSGVAVERENGMRRDGSSMAQGFASCPDVHED